jgi:hypothetical protein
LQQPIQVKPGSPHGAEFCSEGENKGSDGKTIIKLNQKPLAYLGSTQIQVREW